MIEILAKMEKPAEHDYIEKCKHLIECRLEWSSSLEWKNRDYEYLSELIYTKTKISISISTLKRIWKNERIRIPHVSTLNALALFLDYESWNEFKTKSKNEIKPAKDEINQVFRKKQFLYRPFFLSISALVILSIFFFSLKILNSKKIIPPKKTNEKEIVFASKKTVISGLPNTVIFNYDLSKIDFDSAFIQQDWDTRKRKKIHKENQYHNCIYYYPGFYTAKLVVDEQIVKTFPLFIQTDGWMAVYTKEYYQEVPVYLKNIKLFKNNSLYVTIDDLKTNQIENDKDFFIGFFNARDFGNIDCENLIFETEVKNNTKDGGLTCQYTEITIHGKEGMITASFSEAGCVSKLFLNLGDVYIDGTKNNLSIFGTDLSIWRNIKYEIVNKKVSIFLDDKEIYNRKYNKTIGKVTGISYHFYGCGAVKMAKL